MAQNEYLVDGADMTAVADAIRERSGTTAPLSFPVGMAEAVRNIQSGGGGAVSSVNGKTGSVKLTAEDVGAVSVPTTASVGQTIVVKAVDADGKPTEWEAVRDLTREPYELIKEITLTEPVDSINILSSDEGVSLSGAMVLWAIPGIVDLKNNIDVVVPLRSEGGTRYYSYDTVKFRADESLYAFKIVEIKLFDTYSISTIMSGYADKPLLTSQGISGSYSNAICRYTSAPRLGTTLIRDLNTFTSPKSNVPFPAGTIIKLYGVKA